VKRHAEIAGAGLAGLSLAAALGQRGWTVRVHERASELRMFGAGIWLWENGLRSLGAIGAAERTTRNARQIKQWAILDEQGNDTFRREFTPEDHMVLPLRSELYEALIEAALGAGVEIVTDSPVASASPDGELTLASGEVLKADLVVAADGAFSRLRDQLMLTEKLSYLPEGYTRLVVDARPGDEDSVIYEAWNGSRRFLYCPCSEDIHYVALLCNVDDLRGRSIPPDKEYWAEAFPRFADVISRLGDTGRWDRGMTVKCRSWSQGRVVVVGDAAHGMAPNLGQGANMTFTNAVSLAAAVSEGHDVASSLQAWEARERPLTEHVQRWSHGYGAIVSKWPPAALPLRGPFLQMATAIPWVDNQLNRAARHRPVGSWAAALGSTTSRGVIRNALTGGEQ
jgi:2-polyprenyl-6-methoxyphenol hydroxylase-like FAD-dependent oxidoreductase